MSIPVEVDRACRCRCNDTACFGVKIRTDAAKLTNVRIARFRECRDLVRECEMFVEYEAKVTSRVSGVKRRVMYFSKFCLSPMRKNSRTIREDLWKSILHLCPKSQEL